MHACEACEMRVQVYLFGCRTNASYMSIVCVCVCRVSVHQEDEEETRSKGTDLCAKPKTNGVSGGAGEALYESL